MKLEDHVKVAVINDKKYLVVGSYLYTYKPEIAAAIVWCDWAMKTLQEPDQELPPEQHVGDQTTLHDYARRMIWKYDMIKEMAWVGFDTREWPTWKEFGVSIWPLGPAPA